MERWISVARVIVFVAFAACGLAAAADYCQLEPFCQIAPCAQQEMVCYPEYYVWQYTEPDWCLYRDLDEVDIHWSNSANNWHPVAWYVTPASDPGRDGDNYVFDCDVQPYLW